MMDFGDFRSSELAEATHENLRRGRKRRKMAAGGLGAALEAAFSLRRFVLRCLSQQSVLLAGVGGIVQLSPGSARGHCGNSALGRGEHGAHHRHGRHGRAGEGTEGVGLRCSHPHPRRPRDLGKDHECHRGTHRREGPHHNETVSDAAGRAVVLCGVWRRGLGVWQRLLPVRDPRDPRWPLISFPLVLQVCCYPRRSP